MTTAGTPVVDCPNNVCTKLRVFTMSDKLIRGFEDKDTGGQWHGPDPTPLTPQKTTT